jgi:hypothetical protein
MHREGRVRRSSPVPWLERWVAASDESVLALHDSACLAPRSWRGHASASAAHVCLVQGH